MVAVAAVKTVLLVGERVQVQVGGVCRVVTPEVPKAVALIVAINDNDLRLFP